MKRSGVFWAMSEMLIGIVISGGLSSCAGVPRTLAPTAPATVARPSATPTLIPGTYVNPVLDQDFPDPDVLQVDTTYYAYATNAHDCNVQVARSEDLIHWDLLPDALPRLPKWADPDFGWVWAPEVTTGTVNGASRYLLYFTARFAIGADGGRQCIGLSTAEDPAGPFEPQPEPLICPIEQGGAIDAATFNDGGQRYLLWKNDANCCGGQTWIHLQALSPDGLALQGEPIRLLTVDQPWEGLLVEAPTLWKAENRYYLFYSANDYTSPRYAVGYAVADALRGPYRKAAAPLLTTSIPAGIIGPGGQDIVVDPDGETWLLFHSWNAGAYRHLDLAELDWQAGLPVIRGTDHRGWSVP